MYQRKPVYSHTLPSVTASLRGIYERETRIFLDSNFLQDSITGLGLFNCNELL